MFDKSQPLWLPKGSVRAILALMLTGATVYAAVFQGLMEAGILGILATRVINDYFEARNGQ